MRNKNIIGGIIAVIVVSGFMITLIALMFYDIPVGNKDYFTIALQALIGFASISVGFYLGSSYGSAVKTDQNTKIKQEGDDENI